MSELAGVLEATPARAVCCGRSAEGGPDVGEPTVHVAFEEQVEFWGAQKVRDDAKATDRGLAKERQDAANGTGQADV
jgi:hypothetical protein